MALLHDLQPLFEVCMILFAIFSAVFLLAVLACFIGGPIIEDYKKGGHRNKLLAVLWFLAFPVPCFTCFFVSFELDKGVPLLQPSFWLIGIIIYFIVLITCVVLIDKDSQMTRNMSWLSKVGKEIDQEIPLSEPQDTTPDDTAIKE